MFKIVVNTRTGEWEKIENLRVLDIEWWDEFEELVNKVSPETLIQMANVFGRSMK